MLSFFKKEENKSDNIELDIAALLIHAAKIDEKYTASEIEIIKKTLIDLGSNKDELENLLISAEKIESDSNQILGFTKKIKSLEQNIKLKILKSLLKIIYSDGKSDMYESNLVTRLGGLLYLDKKLVGDLKDKVKSYIKK